MKAAVLVKPGKIEIEERKIPQIKKDEVLIKVRHCGICGSDIHYYEHGRIGDFIVENPMVLGHEMAGEIVKAGDAVKNVKPGDLVAVEPGYTCGECDFCRTGRYNLCPDIVFLATPPYDGAFAEYIKYPAGWVYKLPEQMDTIEGALIEPFCVGLHAVMQSDAKVGQSAVILGSGCIGLCTLLALSSAGVKTVYVADVMENRLDMAGRFGASECICVKDKDMAARVMELTDGQGVDLVFETAGNEVTAKQTAELVKRGGSVVFVGMASNPVFAYDFGKLQNKEAKINTVFRYRNLYETAIRMVVENKLPLKEIVTDIYAFSEVEKALEDSINSKTRMVKSVVEF